MSKNKKKASKNLVCTAGEYCWLRMQLANTRRQLNTAFFANNLGTPIPVSDEDQQNTVQAYTILISFYQRAIEAFKVEPGTKVSSPITFFEKFIKNLYALDRDGLINIDVTAKVG